MKKLLTHVPNFFTSLNILAGSIGITLAFVQPHLHHTAYFIALAALFDFLDGFSARALKAYSELGKQLDSLADMVSFGLAPAVIVFRLFQQTILGQQAEFCFCRLSVFEIVLMFSAFLLAIFSALRLAKFNIDTRQTASFVGLPTPANALFIASLPVVLFFFPQGGVPKIILNIWVLLGITVVFSALLVAEIPMFSLKFKHLKFKGNQIRYLFLATVIISLIFLQIRGLVLIIPLYILFSLAENRLKKRGLCSKK